VARPKVWGNRKNKSAIPAKAKNKTPKGTEFIGSPNQSWVNVYISRREDRKLIECILMNTDEGGINVRGVPDRMHLVALSMLGNKYRGQNANKR
jgi:hypothetical protein